MPVDITVTMNNGDKAYYTIPLGIMRGAKQAEGGKTYQVAPDWPWTNPTYKLTLDTPIKQIRSIEIDDSRRMLDTDRSDNIWQADSK